MDKTVDFKNTSVAILQKSFERSRRNYRLFDGQFPSYGDSKTSYQLTPNKNWLASFWAGILWLTAYHSRSQKDIANAQSVTDTFEARLNNKIRLNHDLGFLFTLSARASWQITDNTNAHKLTIRAADVLCDRFNPIGGYIQAWGEPEDESENGRFIIDCMMNLPLLYWASRESGDPRYAEVATIHAQTSKQYLMREDGSTYHTYLVDAKTASPIGPKTHQGYADNSVWARGQAWAIYGFTMAAEWTDETAFKNIAKDATTYYLNAVKSDEIAPWDFSLPSHMPYIPDSSADAIAAGGMVRLARLTGDNTYLNAARDRTKLLIQNAFDQREEAQGLFLHGTQHLPHDYGIDTYTIFGDYFALETIMALLDEAPDFWGPDAK